MNVIIHSEIKLRNAINKLAQSNKKIVNKKLEDRVYELIQESWDYNCWAFTSLLFGWLKRICWLQDKTIEGYLDTKTVPISEKFVKVGDVVAFYDTENYTYNRIEHTAVVYKVAKNKLNHVVLHKPGSGNIEIMSIRDVNRRYRYGNYIIFKRVK